MPDKNYLERVQENLIAGGEYGLMAGTAAIAEPIAGITGLIAEYDGRDGGDFVSKAREKMTYQPRSETARSGLQWAGERLAPVGNYLSQKAVDIEDYTGIPREATLALPQMAAELTPAMIALKAGLKAAPGLPSNPPQAGMVAWHGSPHKHSGQLDSSKIGTGEGAQAYGYGHYLAESKDVAGTYVDLQGVTRPRIYVDGERLPAHALKAGVADDIRMNGEAIAAIHAKNNGPEFQKAFDELKGKKITEQWDKIYDEGHLYEYDLPDNVIDDMLDWDAPVDEYSPLSKTFMEMAEDVDGLNPDDFADALGLSDMYRGQPESGSTMYDLLASSVGGREKASALMQEYGIPGIKYYDGVSRAAGDGTRNFVVFPGNERLVTPLSRNGMPITEELTPSGISNKFGQGGAAMVRNPIGLMDY